MALSLRKGNASAQIIMDKRMPELEALCALVFPQVGGKKNILLAQKL